MPAKSDDAPAVLHGRPDAVFLIHSEAIGFKNFTP